MKFDLSGPIIPGVRVGALRLGMSRAEVIDIIGDNHRPDPYDHPPIILHQPPFRLLMDKNLDVLEQITVESGYLGKVPQGVGVGTSFREAIHKLGQYKTQHDVHFFVATPMTCFEFDDPDTDELVDEMDYFVASISTYRPTEQDPHPGGWEAWVRGLPDDG